VAASREFYAAADKAAGQYNIGIVSLSSGQFETAALAFEAAAAPPALVHARRERAAQARHLASLEPGEEHSMSAVEAAAGLPTRWLRPRSRSRA